MLKIFEQIFRSEPKSAKGYSDDLIDRATARALDATDPRIRILSGHARQMRTAVIHTIDHVLQLVDSLSTPLPMSRADWSAQPLLGAMFASGESLQTALARDAACKDFGAATPHIAAPVTALLLAKHSRKATYGYDVIDDKSVSDVPLTVVSFDEHRLVGLATDEAETRRLLKLRAFDYVLSLALQKITDTQERRKDLVVRKKLLRSKLDLIGRSSASLLAEPRAADKQSLQEKMDQIEAQLSEMGTDDTVLQQHLRILIEILATAEKQLWCENQILHLDNMHYLRSADDARATALPLQFLRDAKENEMAAQLVAVTPASFAGSK